MDNLAASTGARNVDEEGDGGDGETGAKSSTRSVRNDFYVYVIFRPNGVPCYVGKGQGGRWRAHVKNSHNMHLLRIYALADRKLPIVKIREDLSEAAAFETEIALISAMGRADRGNGPLVNLTDGGDGASGHTKSAECRAKISAKNKGIKRTAAQIEQMRKNSLGRKQSEETIRKRVAVITGRVSSAETRAKISSRLRGKRKSAEHIARMSADRKGRPVSQEAREKVRAALKGRPKTPEHNAAVSAAKKGKPGKKPSAATRAKMSAAHRARIAAALMHPNQLMLFP